MSMETIGSSVYSNIPFNSFSEARLKAALISALVAAETKEIDAAVTAGKITAAQAVTLKAGLTAHVTAEVDAVRGAMGPGMGKGGPGHMDGGKGRNH